jgi:uncharacterized membrane protein/nitrite reductase/ring-hydroxylating ferredoxin subunit
MIRDLLEGKPLRAPLHPILVHFPIGLLMLSLLFDLATLLLGAGNLFVRAAYYTMVFGTVMAAVAAIPGLVDWSNIRIDHPGKRIATNHMILNLIMLGVYAINILLRSVVLNDSQTPILLFILSLIGVGLISVSGYLGGTLVYDEGIGVGRHRRCTDTPHETLHPSGEPTPDGFVNVADAASVGDGETLRAEVNGNVIAIVNLGGEFYAFQEFCTHRFGPLSEGSFHGHQVECPWHRSRFDVRTGKVTQGPAKLDLKTYEVSVQDGKIRVRAPSEGSGARG